MIIEDYGWSIAIIDKESLRPVLKTLPFLSDCIISPPVSFCRIEYHGAPKFYIILMATHYVIEAVAHPNSVLDFNREDPIDKSLIEFINKYPRFDEYGLKELLNVSR